MTELSGRRSLFISYNGMLDPLGQSQVIPYLKELAQKGLRFTLLSFERAAKLESEAEKCSELSAHLASYNIEWRWLRYHSSPSLPATIYDVIAGIYCAGKLVQQNRIEIVHARSHIPATIALALKRWFKLKMIFDIRGLMAEEYVDAEHWRKGRLPYRLTKTVERRGLAASDGIVTLTQKIWPIIKQWDGLRGREVIHEVIPCCADLNLYKFSAADRLRRRTELGIRTQFVIVYSGSIDGWYLTEYMADFYAEILRTRPATFLLWLIPNKHERIRSLMREKNIEESSYAVRSASSEDVPSYLSAADAGMAFIRPCLSKIASSPTKYAEYLACGLPLIINAGIGDSDDLVTEERVGALIKEFTAPAYEKAFAEIEDLMSDSDDIRRKTRQVAEKLFDLRLIGAQRYARLYERLLDKHSTK